MRKGINKIVFSIFGGILCSAFALMSVNPIDLLLAENKGNKNGVVWSEIGSEIQEKYTLGAFFNVPNRTLTVDGVQTAARAVLEYPNGTTTMQSSVKLDVSGNYKLRYTASVNGKAYLEEYEFFVVGAQATVQSSKSSISYGAYTYSVDRMALLVNSETGEKIGEKTGDTERVKYDYTCQEGLMVRLARGDTLQFHEIIDLSNVTQYDSLVKAFATPDQQGSPDFEKLIFTFTDVYDPSITLSFYSQHTLEGYDYRKTYSLVGGNGQTESGVDFMDPNKVYVGKWGVSADGSYTRRFKSIYQNANGVWVDDYKEQDEMPIDFRYDAATKTAYVRDYRNATRINKIADLDNPAHFANLWSGFTDGKVRLSITADAYSADTANFCVTEVMGLDLTKTEYVDVEAPILDIDNDYEVMPMAIVGGDYPIPVASAFDLNVGKCQVQTSVWYNYTSKNASLVSVQDGKFKTEKYGDYAIVYEANDGNGNTAKEVLWVRAEKELPQMQIRFTEETLAAATCGAWIQPAAYEIINAVGKLSDVNVRIKAVVDGQEIDAVNGFRPEKAGVYQVVYTATDYIGRVAEAYYTIDVEKGSAPIFIGEPQLPFAFISGKEYVLPALYATDYSGVGVVQKPAYAELTDKEGTKRIEIGEKFVPVVAKQGDFVTIVYKCAYAGGIVESKEYIIPGIVQTGKNEENKTRFFISNYLIGSGFTTTTKKNEITITAMAADGAWTYANSLVAEGFSVDLRGKAGESAFDGLYLTLTDSVDATQTVRIYLQNLADSMKVVVGTDFITVNDTFNNGGGYKIGYSDGAITVGATRIELKNYLSGSRFEGFASGKILLNVAFDGANVGASYALEKLCGEITGTLSSDIYSPMIAILGDYGGMKQIGETFVLPKAIAGDLFDPNVSFTVSVVYQDGAVINDVNGKALDNVDPTVAYTVRLEQYGRYLVQYVAVDSVGNENAWSYTIIVKDETPPTLTFEGKLIGEAKVGDTLVLPKFTVNDNVTAAESLVITKFVYTPGGSLYQLTQASNSIVCSQVGTYEFRVFVMDEEGNMSLYTYTVVVNG